MSKGVDYRSLQHAADGSRPGGGVLVFFDGAVFDGSCGQRSVLNRDGILNEQCIAAESLRKGFALKSLSSKVWQFH